MKGQLAKEGLAHHQKVIKRRSINIPIKTKSIIFPAEFTHVYFVPIGDFHVGNPSGLGGTAPEGRYATKKFRNMVKWIKEKPYAYTFLMGDLFDAVTLHSVGNLYEQEYNIKTAKEFLTEELKPIKDKILGCIDGNHEERICKAVGDSPVNDLSYRLGIEYFPNWCAYLFLSVGNYKDFKKDKRRPYVYSVFLHHLTGGGRTVGGKLNKLKILKSMALADIYCGAHIHLKGAFKEKYLIPDVRAKNIVETQVAFAATGSFMGYADYSIKGQYEKPSTGATRIRLNGEPEKGKDVHISI